MIVEFSFLSVTILNGFLFHPLSFLSRSFFFQNLKLNKLPPRKAGMSLFFYKFAPSYIHSSWENVSLLKILSTFLGFFRPTSRSAFFLSFSFSYLFFLSFFLPDWFLSFLSEIFAFSFSHLWKKRASRKSEYNFPQFSQEPPFPVLIIRIPINPFGSFFSKDLEFFCYPERQN